MNTIFKQQNNFEKNPVSSKTKLGQLCNVKLQHTHKVMGSACVRQYNETNDIVSMNYDSKFYAVVRLDNLLLESVNPINLKRKLWKYSYLI